MYKSKFYTITWNSNKFTIKYKIDINVKLNNMFRIDINVTYLLFNFVTVLHIVDYRFPLPAYHNYN